MLYISKHELGEVKSAVLHLPATWVAQVYLPMFFTIKVKHHIADGSNHLVTLFRLWRQQDAAVRDVTEPYLLMEAWWAHPEPVLTTLLSSPVESDREFAIKKILAVRKTSEGDTLCVRDYAVPKAVNINATSCQDLLDWSEVQITEPVFTANLSDAELESLKERPLCVPQYSIHTQSCERAVKGVTEAAKEVCGWEKRHRLVLARMMHRKKMPVMKTKRQNKRVFE